MRKMIFMVLILCCSWHIIEAQGKDFILNSGWQAKRADELMEDSSLFTTGAKPEGFYFVRLRLKDQQNRVMDKTYTGWKTTYTPLMNGARVVVLSEGKRQFDTWLHLLDGTIRYKATFPMSE